MISKKGLDLIISFEGFKSHPYHCSAGVSTIGMGTTHYEDGKKVTMHDKPISEKRAREILEYEINTHYGKRTEHYVVNGTTQNQLDSLISFAYNLGVGALKNSTLLKYHNQSRHKDAANEFLKWTHSNGRVLKGLVRRRQAERDLYLS